jgi:hypothetical protein
MTTTFESFDAFRAAVVILTPSEAHAVRARLVEARLDPEWKGEGPDQLELRPFDDGLSYTGYLWDYLADKEVVEEEEVWRRVDRMPTVLAMWDIHSTERVRIPNYFRFPKGTVLRSQPKIIKEGLGYLPEDLYLFDESCGWVGALTHEWVDGKRYCVWSA